MSIKDLILSKELVRTAYLKHAKEDVHWLNGETDDHNILLKLTTQVKTRQQGFEKAVWSMACDDNGKLIFKGAITMSDFHSTCDKVLTRYYGMLILGFTVEDEDDEDAVSMFDKEVEGEVKKSKQAKETSTG